MAKKISGKLLSIILVLAICCSTVFGCLMTASAATSWFTFSAGKTTDPELTQAEIELTVTPDATTLEALKVDGMGGMFNVWVDVAYDDGLTFNSENGVKFVSGTKIDGTTSTEGGCSLVGNTIVFRASANDSDIYYSSITVKLTFDVTGGENGQKLYVTATSAQVGGAFESDEEYTTATDADGIIVVGCDHSVQGVGTPHTDTINGYEVYSDSVCVTPDGCGASFGPQAIPTKTPGTTIYWSGETTAPTSTASGEEGDPVIINTAEELAYIAGAGPEYTILSDGKTPKNFKIADGIGKIVLQPEAFASDILALANSDAVQSYFTSTDGLIQWTDKTFTGWNSGFFCGNFDGNGVEIYGMYTNTGRNYAALFPNADGNITIENVAIKNACMINTGDSNGVGWRVAGIVANVTGSDYGVKSDQTLIQLNKCTVANSYFSTTGTSESEIGVLIASATSTAVWVTDCLVYGCQAYAGDSHRVSIIGSSSNSVQVANLGITVPEEYQFTNSIGTMVRNMVRNSIVLDVAPYHSSNVRSLGRNDPDTFVNVHTNMPTESVTFESATAIYTYTSSQINQISPDDAKGAAAASLNGLDFDTVWEIDVNRGYPGFKQATDDGIAAASELELGMLGANLTYKDNGGYDINLYYRPTAQDSNGNNYNPMLYVTQLGHDGTYLGSFRQLDGTVLDASEAAAVDGLQEGDIRYTIDRLSAREIYNTLVATAMVVQDGNVLWGDSADISIAEYAQKVIDGEGTYSSAEEAAAYKTADQNLAQAVLKYGEAAYTALNTKAEAEGKTIYWESTSDKTVPTEIVDGVYIINTAAELAYIACAGPSATAGKKYRVADDISKIVLQPKAYGDAIIALESAAEVREYFTDTEKIPSPLKWAGCVGWKSTPTYEFCGKFDGNGVEIYGMYHSGTAYAGLFGLVDGDVTIENVTIKNAYLYNTYSGSGYRLGAIVGHTLYYTPRYDTNINTVSINRCTVANCYLGIGQDNCNEIGVMAGLVNYERFMINNCLVYGNEAYYNLNDTPKAASLVGQASTSGSADVNGNLYNTVKNSVILGTTPYQSGAYNERNDNATNCFFNVYTDKPTQNITFSNIASTISYAETAIKQITDLESIKGAAAVTNMPGLDWEGTWCYTSGYPTLAAPDYVAGDKIIYWSGNIGTMPTERADDGAYIINTAEEMAYVILKAGVTNTVGKTFRIADDIDKIVLQPKGTFDLSKFLTLSNGAAVQDYFENTVGLENLKNWNTTYAVFDGNFEGNGVEIYGLYGTGVYAGLFPTVDGGKVYTSWLEDTECSQRDEVGITISGITVKNAYLTSTNRLSGLICQGYNSGGANVYGTLNIDSCGVVNSYIKNTNTDGNHGYKSGYSGIITADIGSEIIKINNCLVYGNDATDPDGNNLYIRANMKNNIPVLDADGNATSAFINHTVTNSIILGTSPYNKTDAGNRKWEPACFSNVFTDAPAGTITFDDGNSRTYDPAQITHVELDEITGANATEIVKTLNGGATTPVWYVGNGTYPGFREAGDMIASAQAAYDSIIITDDNADSYGTTTDDQLAVYATSLNLKTNPYIAFTFEFNGKYILNRDKIKITFKTASGTVYETTPPAYVAGQYINRVATDDYGNWTNNKGAGRYHLYRFENLPVKDICSPIEISISYDGTKIVSGASLSLQGYALKCENAYKQTGSDYYDALYDVTKALLFYSQMVEARYGA